MKEEINWNIVGDNRERRKFIIPIGNMTTEEAEEKVRELMKMYNEEIDIPHDFYLPINSTEQSNIEKDDNSK